jgi:hypothetical protein
VFRRAGVRDVPGEAVARNSSINMALLRDTSRPDENLANVCATLRHRIWIGPEVTFLAKCIVQQSIATVASELAALRAAGYTVCATGWSAELTEVAALRTVDDLVATARSQTTEARAATVSDIAIPGTLVALFVVI